MTLYDSFVLEATTMMKRSLPERLRKDAGVEDIEQKLTFAEVKQYLHTREDPAGVGELTLAQIKERFETNDMALEGMKRELQAKRERDLVGFGLGLPFPNCNVSTSVC